MLAATQAMRNREPLLRRIFFLQNMDQEGRQNRGNRDLGQGCELARRQRILSAMNRMVIWDSVESGRRDQRRFGNDER